MRKQNAAYDKWEAEQRRQRAERALEPKRERLRAMVARAERVVLARAEPAPPPVPIRVSHPELHAKMMSSVQAARELEHSNMRAKLHGLILRLGTDEAARLLLELRLRAVHMELNS